MIRLLILSAGLISAGITAQAGGMEDGSELSAAERDIAVDAVKALEEDLASARGKASSPRFGLPETELSREYAAMARTVEHQGSLDILLRAMAGFCVAHPGFKDRPWAHAQSILMLS